MQQYTELGNRISELFTPPFGRWVGLVTLLLSSSLACAQEVPGGCGTLTRPWGPFDYRPDRYIPESTYRSHSALLAIVENAHFTTEVELLIRGKTSGPPAGDIGYTLGVFPNHHRALLAMVALGDRTNSEKPPVSLYTVECWIKRGIAWRPDDNIVRMIYAKYLIKSIRNTEAAEQLKIAAKNANNNPFTFRNIGLLYLEMKQYEEALQFAHKAMALGLNVQPLKGPLTIAGRWVELDIADVLEPAR